MRRTLGWMGLAVFCQILQVSGAHAKLLQIIHTNDLHSHLEHADDRSRGGYAAVKAVIDRIKNEAQATGTETLVLDAGDFSEGSLFYLADRGAGVWQTLNAMGYDAVVLGNHDWLLGTRDLDRVLAKTSPNFAVVAANYFTDPAYSSIKKHVHPAVQFRRADQCVAVMGLTTNQPLYSWRVDDGYLSPPLITGRQESNRLKKDCDYVIALTHLGTEKDVQLAKTSRDIDLIVGGHSHTYLHEVRYQKNKAGKQVPIVQTGEHGNAVGKLLVDLDAKKGLKVVSYELVPVVRDEVTPDPQILSWIDRVKASLIRDYGFNWLYQPIGRSEVPLTRKYGTSPVWEQFLVDAMRESVQADAAITVSQFVGQSQPAGDLSRSQIMTLFPRMFNFDDHLGWNVWTADIDGGLLRLAVKVMVKRSGRKVSFSNIDYDVKYGPLGRMKIKNVRVGGKKVRLGRRYRVAWPEGIARGAIEITKLMKAIFHQTTNTGMPVWTAVEQKIQHEGGVIRADYPVGPIEFPGTQPDETQSAQEMLSTWEFDEEVLSDTE